MSSKGKKNFVNYFEKTKKKSVYITCNVSSEGLVVWVQFDKEDNWDWQHGELILTNLIKHFKLDKIGYKEKPNVLRYKSLYWNPFALTVEYYSPCPKFNSEIFFFDKSFQVYNNEYNSQFLAYIFDLIVVLQIIVKIYNVLQMIHHYCVIILTRLFLNSF